MIEIFKLDNKLTKFETLVITLLLILVMKAWRDI